MIAWIANGIQLKFEHEPQQYEFKNNRSYKQHIQHIDKEHAKHVKTGSWREVEKGYAKVVNPLQVEEQRGKKRMCTDMRYVNAHTADAKFKLETLACIQDIVQKGDMMITTDMSQAYYSMAMCEAAWPYMCWKHRGKYFCSTILTFGLAQAPMYFNKTMRVIVRLCRMLGIRMLNYLDDFFWTEIPGKIDEVTAFVKELLPSLGWIFNDKCVFTPTHIVDFLGMTIDAGKYWVTTPQRKIDDISKMVEGMIKQIEEKRNIQKKEIQQLTGTIRATSIAIRAASAWTREMNRCVAQCEDRGESYISTETQTKRITKLTEELKFWRTIERQNGASISHPAHETKIYVDTGTTGYGGKMGTRMIMGDLPVDMIGTSSTRREIRGLILLTEQITQTIREKRVRFMMDSQPAVANLTNGGGRKDDINEEIKRWWTLCEENKIEAQYEWVPREQNTEADIMSKSNEFEVNIAHMTIGGRQMAMMFTLKHGLTTFETPKYNAISNRIDDAITDKKKIAMIVPEWQAQRWWPTLMTTERPCFMMGTTHDIYTSKSKATREGYIKDIPKYKMWIVVIDMRKRTQI